MIYDTERMEPTMRQKLVEKCMKWIDDHVPAHTRAEYHELLAHNEAMALTIFRQWEELKALRKSYRELEMEVAQSTPMPPVMPSAAFYREVADHPDMMGVEVGWGMDPYRCRMKVMGGHRYDREMFPHIAGSIHRFFHEEYVPKLWAHTADVLASAVPPPATSMGPMTSPVRRAA